MRAETEPWWRQAQADLETAEFVLHGKRFYAASWFVQQAVEKGLKALYIEKNAVLAPRTHDLRYLGREVSAPPALEADMAALNPTFDLTRYPDPLEGAAPVDLVTEERASSHVQAARRIFQWLDQELGRE